MLGGKGPNLAEMGNLGMPVPAGFTITTECCNDYFKAGGRFPEALEKDVDQAMSRIERIMGMKFGDTEKPLLVSCRSGARQSMPGIMDTVLNVGLSSRTLPGLIRRTEDEWFAYGSFRRLIMMYADVVMEKAEGIEPEEGGGIKAQLERIMDDLKQKKNYADDTDFSLEDLATPCDQCSEQSEVGSGR